MTKHDEKPTHHGPTKHSEEEAPTHHTYKKSAPPTPAPSKGDDAQASDTEKDEDKPKGHAKSHAGAPAEAAKPKASRPGCTLCKVTGTSIKYQGRMIPEGTIAEFDDATVLDMPGVLVSQEE